MNIGLNRERQLGLEAARIKLIALHQTALEQSAEANHELNAMAGIRPITDEGTARRLSAPVLIGTAFGMASRIHLNLLEQHDYLASHPTATAAASYTLASSYTPREEIRMVFGRFPSIYRQAVAEGTQQGRNQVLNTLSQDSVPLTELFDLPQASARKHVKEVVANLFGRLHLYPTNTTGICLGVTYREGQPEFKVFYLEQLNIQKSLEN